MSQGVREVIERYASSHDPQCFAEDAEFTQVALANPFNGRDAIAGMLRLFYREAFTDARGDLRHVAADTEQDLGFIEFTFHGRHTGDLLGIAPTGRAVEIQMLGVYEVRDGLIRKCRLYYDMATLLRQLGQLPGS
jgi:steroid delta-isomerase-like uncharacterized protein